jgi:hypothetical protein
MVDRKNAIFPVEDPIFTYLSKTCEIKGDDKGERNGTRKSRKT